MGFMHLDHSHIFEVFPHDTATWKATFHRERQAQALGLGCSLSFTHCRKQLLFFCFASVEIHEASFKSSFSANKLDYEQTFQTAR